MLGAANSILLLVRLRRSCRCRSPLEITTRLLTCYHTLLYLAGKAIKSCRMNHLMSPTSRTYIGPFGRILPVLPNTEPLASEQQHAPIEGTPSSKMATYTLPPPVRLQFGSDPFHGFAEVNKQDSLANLRPSPEQQRPSSQDISTRAYREQLPSVKQLLTPGPQPIVPLSPTPPQYSPDLYTSFSSQPPTRRNTFHETSPPVHTYPQPGTYVASPALPHFVENSMIARQSYQSLAPAPQFHPAYANPLPPAPSPYITYQEPHRHDQYIQQPQQITPMSTSSHYYQPGASSYDQSIEPSLGSGQMVRDPANNAKPLPRLVGEQLIPGEGPCWVYEDGSICKKVIDGEPVNAQWGVTKAGRPRKRLAIACTTCREKKIKCDPAEPKCVQCTKFGRVCRFTTA